MWQKVKIDEVDYLIKHSKNEYRHTILITDLIYLWYEEIEENNLLVRCKVIIYYVFQKKYTLLV